MKLSYEIEQDGWAQVRELPFVIGVLGDFVGHNAEPLPPLRDRKFVEITRDTFDAVIERLRPRLALAVQNKLSDDPDAASVKVDVQFCSLDDFAPRRLGRQIRPLRELLETREDLRELSLRLGTDERLAAVVHRCLGDDTLLQLARTDSDDHRERGWLAEAAASILSECGWSENPWDKWVVEGIANRIATLLSYAAKNEVPASRDAGAILSSAISEIECRVSRQLDAVLQHPAFKKLEATWRALAYLAGRCHDLPQVKIKILNVSRKELLRDLQRAPEYDWSSLYKHVYREFGTFGGQPFSLLVGDYAFAHESEDVELLERIAQVAAATHCPFLAAIEPAMLQLDSFLDLELPRSLIRTFESMTYARWLSFRQSDDSGYVGLVMPRILLRSPHDVVPSGIEAAEFFAYRENVSVGTELLWGNAAFALAANLATGFAKTGLGITPIGPEAGGSVLDLPAWATVSDQGESVLSCGTEIAIADERQVELSALGFIALCQRKGTPEAVFFDLPSCCSSRSRDAADGSPGHRRASVRIDSILVASRFAHYLKCILRDKFGSFWKCDAWESYLDSWIKRYASPDSKDERVQSLPLRDGSVRVESVGVGREPHVIVTLRPRFRNRDEQATLRVVVSLPQMTEVRS